MDTLGRPWEALGDQGGDQEPPRWPGDATPEAYGGHPGGQKAARATRQDFGMKNAHVQGAWEDQNVFETYK